MSQRAPLKRGSLGFLVIAFATLAWPDAAAAALIGPVTDHEFRLTVQNPFDSDTRRAITSGFGRYTNTESLSGSGQESTGEQDVTITPNAFRARLISSVDASGAIASTTAEVTFSVAEPTVMSFSGAAAGRNGLTSGFNIRLRSRTTNQLLLFVDGGLGAPFDWSTLVPITLPAGQYEFKAIVAISSGVVGSNFDDVTALFFSAGASPSGDFDGNGTVGPEDYLVWRNSYGGVLPAGSGADSSGNGRIDAADYALWREAFAMASNAAAVPEPISAQLVAAVGLVGLIRRRTC